MPPEVEPDMPPIAIRTANVRKAPDEIMSVSCDGVTTMKPTVEKPEMTM